MKLKYRSKTSSVHRRLQVTVAPETLNRGLFLARWVLGIGALVAVTIFVPDAQLVDLLPVLLGVHVSDTR